MLKDKFKSYQQVKEKKEQSGLINNQKKEEATITCLVLIILLQWKVKKMRQSKRKEDHSFFEYIKNLGHL